MTIILSIFFIAIIAFLCCLATAQEIFSTPSSVSVSPPPQVSKKVIPKPYSFTTVLDGATLTTVKYFTKNGFRKEMRNGKTVLVMDLLDDEGNLPVASQPSSLPTRSQGIDEVYGPSPSNGFPEYVAIAEAVDGTQGWFQVQRNKTSSWRQLHFICKSPSLVGKELNSMHILALTETMLPVETPASDRLATIQSEFSMSLGAASMASFSDVVNAHPIVGLSNLLNILRIPPGDGVGPMVTYSGGAISPQGYDPARYYFLGYDVGKPLEWWDRFGGSIISDGIYCDLRSWYGILPIPILTLITVQESVYKSLSQSPYYYY